MVRYSLVDGVMVESADGEYVSYAEVMDVDKIAANTLLTQLDGIREQIASWLTD